MKILDVITCIANPTPWKSRTALARTVIPKWLEEQNVRVTLIEVAYGDRDYELTDLAQGNDRIRYIQTKAFTPVWSKEMCWNLGVIHAPHDAQHFMFADADIIYRKRGWAKEVIFALGLYPLVHPWSTCYDLGPNDNHVQVHRSFGKLYREGKPVTPSDGKWWTHDGGPYEYSHTGYALAMTRQTYDHIGGIFDLGAMGSGDHHFFYASIGEAHKSVPEGVHPNYVHALNAYQGRLLTHVGKKIGYVPFDIEHLHHGPKRMRGYNTRWKIFTDHRFDPFVDLRPNSYGLKDFSGNKPDMEYEWDAYLRSRMEDANIE